MKKAIKLTLAVVLVMGATSLFAQKFGRINTQEIIMAMPETKTMQENMDTFAKELSDNIETMNVEFNTKLQDFQKNYNTFSDAIKEVKEKELNDMQTRTREFQERAQQDYQKKQNELLAPIKSTKGGVVNITGKFKSEGSVIDQIKSFEDNVTVKSYLSYSVTADLLGLMVIKKDEPMTVKVTRTILLLPEEAMRPRLADSRIGIFLTDMSRINGKKDKIEDFSVINRWNIQPKDLEAWKRGELVEPVKPIVFYLDDAFPALWREPIRRGVLRWNKAFEKIGFKNVMHIEDFPKDDPEFDPDNLKYSCIRYVPAAVANAMGPSWVDPRSGEIINASVLMYNDVVKLAANWRFVQTAQVDERVRGKELPDDVFQESLEYILAHEVGHCLGLMHNMAASSAFPVDSLRSASFTQQHGTTPSIMDYARFNYVAQPGDKGVKLTPPDLGPYDDYVIKYAYTPLPDKKDMFDEEKTIRGWIDEKVGDPIYRYGRQQVIARYDPTAIEEDLGDDHIKAGDYGIGNLKYVLSHMEEWITDEEDPDLKIRTEVILRTRDTLNRILSERTGKPIEQIEHDTDRDNFMTAQMALEYGLIDKILEKRA